MVLSRYVEIGLNHYIEVRSRLPIDSPYLAHEWDMDKQIAGIKRQEEEERKQREFIASLMSLGNSPLFPKKKKEETMF